MASRISRDKSFHRFTFDCPIDAAIAFDEACIARGQKWSQRLKELVTADAQNANKSAKQKRK